MFQKNIISHIQFLAVVMVAAITVSSAAMMLNESIAEVNRQINIAAIGGLFDLVAVIFLAFINVLAVSSEALLSGAKIGLYTSVAISVAYFMLLLFRQDRMATRFWRLALALVLAEAGAVGASLGAGGLDVRYPLWFSAGAALFGLLASLLLPKSQQNHVLQGPAQPAAMRPMPFATLITLIVAAGAILIFILRPFIQPNRSAAMMLPDRTMAEVITPNNASTVGELARVDAKDVTQALFFPDGNGLAVAMSAGVVLYDATLTPLRTIETSASRRIALSPDGSRLATIAGTNAQVWQVSDGTLLHTLTGHTGTVEDVAFSPDGRMLATASLDRSVRLWRVSSGDLIYTLSHIGHVYSLNFRMDGQILATGSDMGITLWQPTSGLRFRITDVIFAVANDIAFSGDGIRLAAAMDTGNLPLREGNNYSISRSLQRQQALTSLAFSPDGQLLVSGGIDQSLHLWPLTDDGEQAALNGHQGTISSIAFSPDGRLIVTAALDGTVRLWGTEEIGIQGLSVTAASTSPTADATSVSTVLNVATPTSIPMATQTTEAAPRVRVTIGVPASQPNSPLEDPTEAPTNPATATDEPTLSPTATRTATPTAMPIPTQTTAATQMPTRTPVLPGAIVPSGVGDLAVQREVSVGSAADMAYSADGLWLAVAAVDRVLILDGQTLAQLGEIETQATTLSFSPNGEFLATASATVASLWRIADGELLEQFELHSSAIMDIAFSPDGTTLATASLDKMARLWRISDATLLHQFSHFGSVHSLAFSPDGALLTTGTTVGAVQWQVSDGRRIRVLTLNPNRANRLSFSADGQNLAAATENGNIWMWRAGGAGEWLVLQGHTNAATDVVFSADGQLLASASADGTLRLWRMSDGTALRSLSGKAGAVTSVLFHPDGTTLLIATADATLREWGLPAPTATPTVQTPPRPIESGTAADIVSPLPIHIIKPVELTIAPSDWQSIGPSPNTRFFEVTHCGDGLLWYMPDLTQGAQGVWSFDGQQWEMYFAGNLATVACAPEGAPYALVIPLRDPAEIDGAANPPVRLYRRESGQWIEVVAWDYGYKIWEEAKFFDFAVDRNGNVWLPGIFGGGTEGSVISALLRFDSSDWHIYVGSEENRFDDPQTRVGALLAELQNLQIHKTLPRGYDQPPAGEWSLPLWTTDIDIAADGTIWMSRPFLWPQYFDGQRWLSVMEPQLTARMNVTLAYLGIDQLGDVPPDDAAWMVSLGTLDGDGTPWLGVAGGVLHRQQGRWVLFHLPRANNDRDAIVPLASGADGVTWFWDADSLLRYDGVIWQRFTGDESFRTSIGESISVLPGPLLDATVGPDGALWIGGFRFLPGGTPLSLPAESAQQY